MEAPRRWEIVMLWWILIALVVVVAGVAYARRRRGARGTGSTANLDSNVRTARRNNQARGDSFM